ncbi:MAG TPA: 3-deoxy-7-phosphoheptulonate synthase [Bryobacteraceae bacterium]|nr:3-deoxy-7-phosphoheptulonate synthase [Bryobacteraceae bacterium]
MIVVMEEGATEVMVQNVIDRMVEMEFTVHRSTGVVHTVLGGVGPEERVDPKELEVLEGVKECHRIMSPYKLASRHFRPSGTVVKVRDVEIGGNQVVLMAGPCSVESRDQIARCASIVAEAGGRVIRGGAFKPRSSPYSFQGLGEEGLQMIREAADANNLLVISEVMDASQISLLARHTDILQVGARNMQNFTLLRELSKIRKPILLKRGIAATIEELLLSAEYVLSGGNYEVILCERGIRTFESYTRNTMDLSAIPVVHKLSHLPIVADPSHGTGRREQVIPMARAAVAAGADGLLVEMHPDPDHALSDGAQSLRPEQLMDLSRQLRMIAPAVGRKM